MFTARVVAGKAVYAVSCLAAAVLLVVSGYAHKAVGQITGLEKGIAISGTASAGSSAGSSAGAMNILLMGLESRTNFQGQTLSSQLLTETHSGSVFGVNNLGVGSQDTDTLILIHIFAGGQKAVGFSIPRDDLVTYPAEYYPGVTQGKIDGAYYFAYAYFLNQNASMSSNERYLKANQAGEAAEVATVEAVTGQHVDHFVETNLEGFFYLAAAFGGIEVCVKPWPGSASLAKDANLADKPSGWEAVADGYNVKKGGDQYLHLAADQALAYIRDRDSLPEVDFDRTRRQQAVLDYVIWKLKHEGAFSDLAMITGLLGTANQYVITDANLNLLDFATDMRALSGKNLSFQTLPGTPENDVPLNGSSQDVVVINVPQIQELVKNAFYPPPTVKKTSASKKTAVKKTTVPAPAASTVTVDVYNGGATPGLATSVSQALVVLGYKAGTVADATEQPETVETANQVFYGAGASANAAKIATQLGTTATSVTSLPAGHVEVLLGSTSAAVPAGLTASGTSPASTATTATPTPAPTSTAGTEDGTGATSVTVTANAPYGIPCVY
jgi:LCP family protein required for cell wall assembly